jgi:hypothetical protein
LTPPTMDEEEEGTRNVAESTDVLKNGDTGPKKTVKMLRQKPNDRVQALATRLSVSEVARRNAEDKFNEQYAHAVGLGKQILAFRESQKVVDHFPYAFWPPLPWTQAPLDLANATPPHIWDARNKAPEHVKHERQAALAKRQDAFVERRRANLQAWLQALAYPDHADTEKEAWRGARLLGSGAYGCSGLWVRTDAKNRIIERMAAKDCIPSHGEWHNPSEWRMRMPREVRMHQLVETTRMPASHQNLARYRSHRTMMAKKRYRVYQDLCDGGRLHDALRTYFRRDSLSIAPEIPESFVWHLMSGLVDACLVLEQGGLDGPVKGWKPLVHTDLHFANVLLERDPDDDMVSGIRETADDGRS